MPNVRIDAYAVYTNNILTMAMRGFGATQPPAGYELQMDKLAEALGMDPVELRMRNLLEDGMVAVTGNTMIHGTGIRRLGADGACRRLDAYGGRLGEGLMLGPASAPHKVR